MYTKLYEQLILRYGDSLGFVANGQCMCEELRKLAGYQSHSVVAFNEAIVVGEVVAPIFSASFNAVRARTHNVSRSFYESYTVNPLIEFLNCSFEVLVLIFDTDLFCQMNVLTLLSYLEQIQEQRQIILVTLGDEYSIEEITHSHYLHIFESVMIAKTYDVRYAKYFELQQDENEIASFIKAHLHLSEVELLIRLFDNFESYGLGDSQYLKMIQNIKA